MNSSLKLFGLEKNPFRTAPDPNYYYPFDQHSEILEKVLQCIREKAGLALIMGGIGRGKTMILRMVQEKAGTEFEFGYLGNPFLDAQEFGHQILIELGAVTSDQNVCEPVRVLQSFLQKRYEQMRPVVLFVDEAHLLSPEVLELILVITNLQKNGDHLLQMVLSGQPEFEQTLVLPRFSSLNQRLGNRFLLLDLNKRQSVEFIRHRVHTAGGNEGLFTLPAMHAVWKMTRGNPRLINQVCARLLDRAAQKKKARVGWLQTRGLNADPLFKPVLRPYKSGKTMKLGLAAGLAALILFYASSVEHKVLDEDTEIFSQGSTSAKSSTSDQINLNDQSEKIQAKVQSLPERQKKIQNADQKKIPKTKKPEFENPVVIEEKIEPAIVQVQKKSVKDKDTVDALLGQKLLPPPGDYHLDAVVWDESPEQRLIVLNEKILRQGEMFGEYKISEIMLDAVILETGGLFFELKAKDQADTDTNF